MLGGIFPRCLTVVQFLKEGWPRPEQSDCLTLNKVPLIHRPHSLTLVMMGGSYLVG